MDYYLVDFGYYPCPVVNMPGDDEDSQEAGLFNSLADRAIDEQAKKLGIEVRHAYSWPDRSLYKNFRTEHSKEKIRELFDFESCFENDKDRKVTIKVWVGNITPQDPYRLQTTGYLSLEEIFELNDREEINQLIQERIEERKSFYADYYHHRDNCSGCRKYCPPCASGSKLHDQAVAAEREWRNKNRAMNHENT